METDPRPGCPGEPAARFDAVRLLSLDAHGRVLDWMSWQSAACLYARDAVAWTLGDPCLTLHGGISRTGEQRDPDRDRAAALSAARRASPELA